MATKYALVGVAFFLFVGPQALGQQPAQESAPTSIVITPPRELTDEEKYGVKKSHDEHIKETEKAAGEAAKRDLPKPPPQLPAPRD